MLNGGPAFSRAMTSSTISQQTTGGWNGIGGCRLTVWWGKQERQKDQASTNVQGRTTSAKRIPAPCLPCALWFVPAAEEAGHGQRPHSVCIREPRHGLLPVAGHHGHAASAGPTGGGVSLSYLSQRNRPDNVCIFKLGCHLHHYVPCFSHAPTAIHMPIQPMSDERPPVRIV